MCVKPEQASKVKSWTPTRLNNGKARVGRGSNRQTHPFWSIGVVGTACRKGEPGNWGRPVAGEGSGLNVVAGRRLRRVSEGPSIDWGIMNKSIRWVGYIAGWGL